VGSLPNESIYFEKHDIIARTRDPSGILYGPEKAARARQNPGPVYTENRECQVTDHFPEPDGNPGSTSGSNILSKEAARVLALKVWAELDGHRRQRLIDRAGACARQFLRERPGRIFLTAPIGDEVDILSSALELRCDLFLPVIREDSMDFFASKEGGITIPLKPGRFRIPEPQGGRMAIPDENDLMFVPSLACNGHRFRLGRGGGFFDRYFAANAQAKKCRKVSVLPVELIEIHFPEQSHDVKLDELVTDTGTVE
jgi:5,10-methenyltetrahydrofolate synthetase